MPRPLRILSETNSAIHLDARQIYSPHAESFFLIVLCFLELGFQIETLSSVAHGIEQVHF